MIGTKTLATLTLLASGLAAALALGVLAPERLARLGPGALFLVGGFAVVVGALTFRFWRLGEKSNHYLRYSNEPAHWDLAEGHFLGSERRRIVRGENKGEAFDLPARAALATSIALAFLLALAFIDPRALDLVARFRRTMNAATSTYCPRETEVKKPAIDPNEPGCELIRRAYALGYAKSLGACEPKKQRVEAAAVCTRRQLDEPLLHYAWRLLARFWNGVRENTGLAYFRKARRDFRARVRHMRSLQSAEREVLASAPHASHHIWTNLPDPGDGAFRETTCANRYLRLPHRPSPSPGEMQDSKVFEHVVAQLLFEASYEPAAGSCREYHVHWGAPLDACERLVKSPETFLSWDSALEDVRAVLERYRLEDELVVLGGRKPSLEPAAFVSFHCYIEQGWVGDEGQDRTSKSFTLDGHTFTAEQMRVRPPEARSGLYIDRYHAIAELLVNGFHYGRLMSEGGLEQGATAGVEASFAGDDFLLARLFELDSIDIYVEPGWIADRPDLLEVYPYQHHLKNYVQTFRRQYRGQRGRL